MTGDAQRESAVATRRRPAYRGNTRNRAGEKWAILSAYLMRWHFASADILLRVLGLTHSKGSLTTLSRLVEKGWLHRVVTEYSDRYPIYLLSAEGKAEAFGTVFPNLYSTLPSKLRYKEVLHNLAVQRAAMSFPDAVEIVPARLIRSTLIRRYQALIEPVQARLDELHTQLESLNNDEHWQAVRLMLQWQDGETLFEEDAALLEQHEDRITKVDLARLQQLDDDQRIARRELEHLNSQRADALVGKEPDALITTRDGVVTALEVERTEKSKSALIDTFRGHVKRLEARVYQRVTYLCRNEGLCEYVSYRFNTLPASGRRGVPRDVVEKWRRAFEFRSTAEIF